MKSLLAIILGLALALPLRADSVAGPIAGIDEQGNALAVVQATPGSQAFAVYQVDAAGAPIELSGFFYFRGVGYFTGYQYAITETLYAKNHQL
jgi:hypothetical protein